MENVTGSSNKNQQGEQMDSQTTNKQYEQVIVIKVIDGDTFIASDGRRVRLIGVDTPEYFNKYEKFGELAKKYTTDRLLGKTVWMERDVSDVDCYSRYLRIVWLQKPVHDRNIKEIEDKMFNAHLLNDGFALATPYYPDVKYRDIFNFITTGAKMGRRGIWSFVKQDKLFVI